MKWFVWTVFLIPLGAMVQCAVAHAEPQAALPYERMVIRECEYELGPDGPCALFGAQIQAESNWRPKVIAYDGGRGLAQFMPETWDWIQGLYSDKLGTKGALDPETAITALVLYDHYLFARVPVANSQCARWAFTLASYNGGLGNLQRDTKKCARFSRCNPADWFKNVELYSDRGAAAFHVNRAYPRRILLGYQPNYAAWGATVECKL